MKRWGLLAAVLIAGILLGTFVMYQISRLRLPVAEVHAQRDATVLLEQIKEVYKLIVLEGEFSEILDHRDYYGLNLPGFRKKAILKVKAKVSVGYDLNNLQITAEPLTQTLYIENLPEPEILTTEHDITYYDLEEGIFNSFTERELSELNRAAKDSIKRAAERGMLIATARTRAREVKKMIELWARQQGWKVAYGNPPSPAIKTKQPEEVEMK